MPALRIEAAAGLHPYGSLENLYAFHSGGQKPYLDRGMTECPPAAFANLKNLGPALRRTPRLARLALAAALTLPYFRQADSAETKNCALVVATAFGSVTSTFDFMDSLLADGPDMASPTAFSHSVTNMTAAMLGQHLHVTGPAMTITDAEGDPFTPALLTAAGVLESGGVERVLLCAVEESHARMNGIAATYSNAQPSMEGAVLFVLSRGSDEACPHVVVPTSEEAPAPAISGTAPAVEVHGPGILALAWNIALSFLALQNEADTSIRCLTAHDADAHSGVLLTMGSMS